MDFCHGTDKSIRLDFAMWSWSFKRVGYRRVTGFPPVEIFVKLPLGSPPRRNWMPHRQPEVCPRCGFVFAFAGCSDFHLSDERCVFR